MSNWKRIGKNRYQFKNKITHSVLTLKPLKNSYVSELTTKDNVSEILISNDDYVQIIFLSIKWMNENQLS